MRFWDTSALVPLLVEEAASPQADEWVTADRGLVVWTLTETELHSALQRRVREGTVEQDASRELEQRIEELVARTHVIRDVDGVKAIAGRVLRTHPLRGADALQLAAALLWVDHRPDRRWFHSFDERLAAAARIEGFRA